MLKSSNIVTAVVVASLASAAITYGVSHHQYNNLKGRLARIEASLAALQNTPAPLPPPAPVVDLTALQNSVERLTAWAVIPPMKGLAVYDLGPKKVKSLAYSLNMDADPMRLRDLRVPKNWKPDPQNPEKTMPYAWPPAYVGKFKQPFNADTVLINFGALANWVKDGGDPSVIRPYVDFMLARMSDYITKTDNDGDIITYRFEYAFHDQPLHPGWVSAYATGSALAALSYLSTVVDDDRLRPAADRLFRGMMAFDGPKWVTMVDENQYLWLEEYPLDGPKKAHVFNGHMWAAMGLFEYFKATNDPTAKLMTQASITTMKRFLHEFRAPGRISRYDLYADYNADYAPHNIINEVRALGVMTGDQAFGDFADALMTDMPYAPPGDSSRVSN